MLILNCKKVFLGFCLVTSSASQNLRSEKKKCRGYTQIPFAITNIEGKHNGNKLEYGYHSDRPVEALYFLKDVVLCDYVWRPYVITGTKRTETEFKDDVKNYLKGSKYDQVLYNIHGVNVSPNASFKGAANNMQDFLVIPIQWRNLWGLSLPSYETDRNNAAPKAGKLLAKSFDVFRVDYKISIMCHSMGNWVFRVFAQNVVEPEVVFHNFFSVAADARMDMFWPSFNPGVKDKRSYQETDSVGEVLDLPKIELVPNGGLAITQIAQNTHVIWNKGDHALAVREQFQIGAGSSVRMALGKYGDQAEKGTTQTYFKERVQYHDFSKIIEHLGIEHNYQWFKECKAEYTEYKDKGVDAPTFGGFN